MPVLKFTYSWVAVLFGIGLPVFMIMALITQMSWGNCIYCIIISIILGLAVAWISKRFLTYDLHVKTALTLDRQKIEYHSNNIILYWEDIISINYTRYNVWGQITYANLITKSDGSISIYLQEIAGDSKYLYDTIVYYHNKLTINNQFIP